MGINAIVGQSGGPTCVINSSLAGVFSACRKHGVQHVYGMRHGVQGLLKDDVVNLTDVLSAPGHLTLLRHTPASYLGSCRYKLPESDQMEAVYQEIFDVLRCYDIGYFFYIGGNDSMDTLCKMGEYGRKIGSDIRFVGVPKTIDNDLDGTDHTPGFGSAAKYIGSVMKEVIRDNKVYGSDLIAVVEIMGRNAGWLTAASALSKAEDCEGPEMILLPEITFDPEKFLSETVQRHKEKKAFVIAVSEGIMTKDGKYVCEMNKKSEYKDAFGHTSLGGTALFLADFLAQNMGIKTRGFSLGPLQRCASHIVSRTDMTEAFQVGAEAVKEAVLGKSEIMTVIKRLSNAPYRIDIMSTEVSKIANVEKKVPLDWINSDNISVTKQCVDYMKPLIIGELSPFMVEGMPRHLFLNS